MRREVAISLMEKEDVANPASDGVGQDGSSYLLGILNWWRSAQNRNIWSIKTGLNRIMVVGPLIVIIAFSWVHVQVISRPLYLHIEPISMAPNNQLLELIMYHLVTRASNAKDQFCLDMKKIFLVSDVCDLEGCIGRFVDHVFSLVPWFFHSRVSEIIYSLFSRNRP